MNIKSFKDLKAWQESHKLVLDIYQVTQTFPKHEQFGITNQLRRAAVSITSNIAEGFGRIGTKDKQRFFHMSLGSLLEVENQIEITHDLKYINSSTYQNLNNQIRTSGKLINGLIKSTIKNYK